MTTTMLLFVFLLALYLQSDAFRTFPISHVKVSRKGNYMLQETNRKFMLLRMSTPENPEDAQREKDIQDGQQLVVTPPVVPPPEKTTFAKGIKNLFSGKGWNGKAFLTKEKFAKLGINCLLSYGFVSNISYISCFIIAWVTFGRRNKISPLAPGQWKQFLLIYSGLWVANNIIRPARFSLSLLIAPLFDKAIKKIEKTTKLGRVRSTALLVFLVNVCGTISYLVFGLLAATKIANVPLWP
jgi:hypothetical protein